MMRAERETDRKIKQIQCDNAEKFKKLAEVIEKDRIVMEFTISYTSEQNDVAEHVNQTLLMIMRALIFDFKMSKVFWLHAAKTASYIHNQSVKIRSAGRSAR